MLGKNLIAGQWVGGEGASWERRSPAEERVVWSGHWANPSQTLQAIAAARGACPRWSETSLDDRMNVCRKFASLVSARKEELAELIAVETGKPRWEAATEVTAVIGKVGNSIDAILKRRWTTTEQVGDFMAVTRYRPHGVMLVIGPYNFPAHIPGGHIVPALLAGNTIVFKPSELTPGTGQWLAGQWQSAGLPPGVMNVVQGGADVAIAAVEHEDVDGVLFTGSYRVGSSLHRRLAGQPNKVLALELGGNNPLVVHNTSDYRGAAITCILSAYVTSGQRCTCLRRLIITGEEAYTRLVDQLCKLVPKIRCGLPLDDPQPFMGPLIHSQAAAQMLQAQQDLLSGGASALVRMELDERCAALVRPGLIARSNSASSDDCEHFGPLLVLQQAVDLDEAIALAGATKYGLSAGFIGDDVKDFHYFLHRVRAGVVNWNRQTTGASGKLPFGGVGLSGNHHPSGYFAADYCSYPVASLESHELDEARMPVPGLEFGDAD